MHNLKEIRKNLSQFQKKLEQRNVKINLDAVSYTHLTLPTTPYV